MNAIKFASLRVCFLQYCVLLLAVAAGGIVAYDYGAFNWLWKNDLSHLTSVIGGVLVLTLAYIGLLSWNLSSSNYDDMDNRLGTFAYLNNIVMSIALLGTVAGISFQAAVVTRTGAGDFTPLATSLWCTGCGMVYVAVVSMATLNLEQGIRRLGLKG